MGEICRPRPRGRWPDRPRLDPHSTGRPHYRRSRPLRGRAPRPRGRRPDLPPHGPDPRGSGRSAGESVTCFKIGAMSAGNAFRPDRFPTICRGFRGTLSCLAGRHRGVGIITNADGGVQSAVRVHNLRRWYGAARRRSCPAHRLICRRRWNLDAVIRGWNVYK